MRYKSIMNHEKNPDCLKCSIYPGNKAMEDIVACLGWSVIGWLIPTFQIASLTFKIK